MIPTKYLEQEKAEHFRQKSKDDMAEKTKSINCENCDQITEVNKNARERCPTCGSYRVTIIRSVDEKTY